MGKVKVKEVYEKDRSSTSHDDSSCIVDPILVRFQHADVARTSGNVNLNKIFRTAVFQSDPSWVGRKDFSHLSSKKGGAGGGDATSSPSKGRKMRKQLLAIQSEEMTYLGTTGEEEEPLKTYVALRQGKKMKVYEVTPITVAPFIEGHSYVVEKERETGIKKSRSDRREAAIDLIKSFGSKRKRLNYERLEKNKIDASDMNESMTKASAQLKPEEEEPKIKDETVLTLIPRCNRETDNVHEVYDLEDIIAPEEMKMMDDLADEFLSLQPETIKEWQAVKKFSDYFFSMWHKLTSKRSDPRCLRDVKLVLYTELLIKLHKMTFMELRKKNVDLPDVFPKWLVDKVLESFTCLNAKGQRTRSDALKDKTVCYSMVLVLLANDFVLDMGLMSTSFNVHIKKLITLAKGVGVSLTYNSATKEHRGVLRCPLPKPIETRGRKRKSQFR